MKAEINYKVWDIEGNCWIPQELVAIMGDGTILTRESEDEPWMVETIDVNIYFDYIFNTEIKNDKERIE